MTTHTKPAAPEPKVALSAKTRKAKPGALQSATNAERLVCRYCGSDDLAPSFKKRGDARCRACSKKRYGSAAHGKKAMRARKPKATK